MREKLLSAFTELGDGVIAAAPKVVIGLVLMVVAVIVAKLIERGLRYLLQSIKLDSLLGKAGLDQSMQNLGLKQELSLILPRIVYFLVLLLLIRTATDGLGLTAISGAIAAFFGFLPNIVSAVLLLVLGTTVGQFFGDAVRQSGEASGLEFAPTLGKLVSGLIMFVCGMMAIAQLQINTDIILIVTSGVLGAIALAFGLAFGLGTRDIIRNIAAGFYIRRVLVAGKPTEIAGHKGTLVAITATHVVIEENGRETMVSNATLLDQTAKQDS
jgi:hypothetical protein